MAHKSMKVTLRGGLKAGGSPLLMHGTKGMDPTSGIARDIRAITSKQAKSRTDEDNIELARLEWLGGLYWSKDSGVFLPGPMLEAVLRDAGRSERLGKEVQRSVLIHETEIPLIYDGPRDPKAMWADADFRFATTVKVGQSRVIRTRPLFENWSVEVTYQIDVDYLDLDRAARLLDYAGKRVGLGDYRPRFGRFSVEFADDRLTKLVKTDEAA